MDAYANFLYELMSHFYSIIERERLQERFLGWQQTVCLGVAVYMELDISHIQKTTRYLGCLFCIDSGFDSVRNSRLPHYRLHAPFLTGL